MSDDSATSVVPTTVSTPSSSPLSLSRSGSPSELAEPSTGSRTITTSSFSLSGANPGAKSSGLALKPEAKQLTTSNNIKRPPRKSTMTQQQKNQKRQRATSEQLLVLESEFQRNPTPTAAVRDKIAVDINMTERRAKVKQIAKRGLETGEGWDQVPMSMRQYLSLTNDAHGLGVFHPMGQFGPGFPGDVGGKVYIQHIDCQSLTIGKWMRLGQSQMDLVVFYTVEKKTISYFIHSDQAGYKIEYPFHHVASIGLETGKDGKAPGIVIELNQPPHFLMDSVPTGSGGTGFTPVGDFTEDFQATQCLVHHLGGNPKVLEAQLSKLMSLDAFANRHQQMQPLSPLPPMTSFPHAPFSQVSLAQPQAALTQSQFVEASLTQPPFSQSLMQPAPFTPTTITSAALPLTTFPSATFTPTELTPTTFTPNLLMPTPVNPSSFAPMHSMHVDMSLPASPPASRPSSQPSLAATSGDPFADTIMVQHDAPFPARSGHTRQRSRSVPNVQYIRSVPPADSVPSFMIQDMEDSSSSQSPNIFMSTSQAGNSLTPLNRNLRIDTGAGFGMEMQSYPMSGAATSPSDFSPCGYMTGTDTGTHSYATTPYTASFNSPLANGHSMGPLSPLPYTGVQEPVILDSPTASMMGENTSPSAFGVNCHIPRVGQDDSISMTDMFPKQLLSLDFESQEQQSVLDASGVLNPLRQMCSV